MRAQRAIYPSSGRSASSLARIAMNERPTALRPGDMVISLRHVSIVCALVTGCITVGMLLYRAGMSGLLIFAGIALGALGGIGTGWTFSRKFHPARPGHIFVVRQGRSALPLTLGAALIPSLLTAFLAVTVIAALGFSPLGAGLLVGSLVATSIACVIGSGSALIK